MQRGGAVGMELRGRSSCPEELASSFRKFEAVIGGVVVMRAASARRWSVHGWVSEMRQCPIPHPQILLAAWTLARA
jgi:hypothetical protein